MILVDLNVVLDVIQSREPHNLASEQVLDRIVKKQVGGLLAAHAVTTIHYLVGRYQSAQAANETVDFLLRHFQIATIGRDELQRARNMGWRDFEDAVVAAAAETAGCSCIVSRNAKDFSGSLVAVQTPEEYLATL